VTDLTSSTRDHGVILRLHGRRLLPSIATVLLIAAAIGSTFLSGCGQRIIERGGTQYAVQRVSSSAIHSAGYDHAGSSRSLYVKFHSGHEYRYADVPPHVYRAFLDAPSKGHFFNSRIKGNYRCTRLRP